MDQETLQALIKVYKARASTDLLSIIVDEAEGPLARSAVLELLRSVSSDLLSKDEFAPVRRKACQFCLNAEDFELAERLARGSDLPDDRALRARALHGLNREQEAAALYRQAIVQDPAIRNRELERLFGIRPGASSSAPAQIISLNTYSSRRENKSAPDRREPLLGDPFLDDFDEGTITFGDVAGLDEIKAEIRRRVVLPYLKPSLFERYKQKAGGNILLYGPPGCGKTLIAKATAGESDARFLSINPGDVLDRQTGESEKRLQVLFDEARSDTPAILFFDDFHLLVQKRSPTQPDTGLALMAAFASEMDGTLRNNAGVLVIVATNAPWLLPKELFRAGRFQAAHFVPPPSMPARKKILTSSVSEVPGHDKVDFERIAKRSEGMSGADIRALSDWVCNTSLTKALAGTPDANISTALFEEGLKLISSPVGPWLSVAKSETKTIPRDEPRARLLSPLFRN